MPFLAAGSRNRICQLPLPFLRNQALHLAYTKKGQTLRIPTDKTAITSKAPLLAKIADLVKKSREE